MSEAPGAPAPLSASALAVATLAALVVAGVALAVYILPASYGVDPVGAGEALGIEGQPPGDDAAGAGDAAEDVQAPGNRTTNATQERLHRFQATWPTSEEAGPSVEGYTPENRTSTVDLDLPTGNVTQVTVNLTWTDDNETAGQRTAPDELELVLEAPDGTTTEPVRAANDPGQPGILETTLLVQRAPGPNILQATDAGSARERVLANTSTASLDGAWTAHVTVVEAGNAQTGETALPETGSQADDAGTSWQLDATATTYELALEDLGPTGVRSETRTFELPAGEGMEHKVLIEEGNTLEYTWEANGDLFYDLHGEPEGDPANFTSHETGTAAADSGNLTAPFTGTHGWYWENRGDETVTITLRTTGDYADGFTT